MTKTASKLLTLLLALSINFPAYLPVAQAEMIGTQPALSAETRNDLLDTAEAFLLQDNVAKELQAMGVSQDKVMERVQQLTDEELLALSAEIEDAPAGAGIASVIGVVFIVLIILEVVGAIDIFNRI